MYNEERKQEFLNFYGRDPYIIAMFNATEDTEKYLDKDVSEFREDEILELLKGFNSFSLDSLNVRLSVLRKYSTWCEQRNLLKNNMNCYKNLYKKDIAVCINEASKNQRIVDRDTVLGYCRELWNPSDKLFVLCVFEGMSAKDLGPLTKQSMTEDHVLHLDNRDIKVSDELYNAFLTTNETDYYIGNEGYDAKGGLIDNDWVFRPRCNASTSSVTKNINRLKMRFTKNISRVINPNLTLTSLRWSGIINQANFIAQEKMCASMYDAVDTPEFANIVKQYDLEGKSAVYIKAKIKNYLE